jgi:hypothetical protein
MSAGKLLLSESHLFNRLLCACGLHWHLAVDAGTDVHGLSIAWDGGGLRCCQQLGTAVEQCTIDVQLCSHSGTVAAQAVVRRSVFAAAALLSLSCGAF